VYRNKVSQVRKTKNQHKIDEAREYFKAKQLDIGFNEDTQKIRLRRIGAIPVDFKITEFVKDTETVSEKK